MFRFGVRRRLAGMLLDEYSIANSRKLKGDLDYQITQPPAEHLGLISRSTGRGQA